MRSACSRSARLRKAAVALLCAPLLCAASAWAAPQGVEHFDAGTWEALQKSLPRPAAIVFTATYCASCPAVLARVAEALRKRDLPEHIVAVVIDEASSQELMSSSHYSSATRLFAFSGDEARLRYGVDPRWRGVTPYVALLGPADKISFIAGSPSDAQIEAWLAAQ